MRIVKQAIGTEEEFPQTNYDVLHYTEEDIEALDQAGISKPVSTVDIDRIMGEFYDAYHDPGCAYRWINSSFRPWHNARFKSPTSHRNDASSLVSGWCSFYR